MINIFVLEDDAIQQARMERMLDKATARNAWTIGSIQMFSKPEELLDSICEYGPHQLFFLDIQIDNDEQKGFEVAQAIRDRDPYATIVFTTTHSEFMPLTFQYKLAALDFIDKFSDEERYLARIEDAIRVIIANMGQAVAEDAFHFETAGATLQVPFHNILYFETSATVHKVILHTKNDRIEFYGRLSQIEKTDKRLYKCHKSFVVNPENITKVDKETGTIHFENGDYCYVSKLKQKKVIEKMRGDKE